MSDEDQIPPMDPRLHARLREARGTFDDEANARAEHAFARLAEALPSLRQPRPGGDGRNGGAGDGSPRAGDASSVAGVAGRGVVRRLAGPVVAAFVAGAGVGGAVTHALQPVQERVVYVDRPHVAEPAAASARFSSTASADVAPGVRVEDLPSAAARRAATGGSAPTPPASPSARISAERLLLDDARLAFASGDFDKALTVLRQHEERFPGGVLAEEREALAVRTLAALGRKSEAEARGRAFVTRYPGSIMRPVVEAAAAGP